MSYMSIKESTDFDNERGIQLLENYKRGYNAKSKQYQRTGKVA